MDTTMDRDTLGAKLLPELQQIAQGMGVEGAQKLRKAGLIDAIVAASTNGGGHPSPPGPSETVPAKPRRRRCPTTPLRAMTTRAMTRRPRKATEPRLATRGTETSGNDRGNQDRGNNQDRGGARGGDDRDRSRNQDRNRNQDRGGNQDRAGNQDRPAGQDRNADRDRNPTVTASSIAAAAVPRARNAVVSARSAE